jgi:hypothetical protein
MRRGGIGIRVLRWVAVCAIAGMAVMIQSTAAFAKGDLQPTSMAMTITGPGLDRPISATWRGSCFVLDAFACSNQLGFHRESQGFPSDLGRVSGPVWTLGNDSNFLAQANGAAGSYLAPKGDLGPKYEVRWVITIGSRTQTIEQALYPWGPPPLEGLPTVPWLLTVGGHTVFGQRIGSGWMPATSVYFQDLVAAGMPSVAPPGAAAPVPARTAAEPGSVPAHSVPNPARATAVWPIVLGGLLLVALVAAGVAVGRPRRGLRTARTARAG